MKKIIIAVALTCATAGIAHAETQPCSQVFCMWGYLNGEQDSKCTGEIKDFFDIKKKNKHGYLPGKTFNARNNALQKDCPKPYGANSFIEKIMNKFGKQKNK